MDLTVRQIARLPKVFLLWRFLFKQKGNRSKHYLYIRRKVVVGGVDTKTRYIFFRAMDWVDQFTFY
jgi:hypothetical protein